MVDICVGVSLKVKNSVEVNLTHLKFKKFVFGYGHHLGYLRKGSLGPALRVCV
jgi:hypothetical protein